MKRLSTSLLAVALFGSFLFATNARAITIADIRAEINALMLQLKAMVVGPTSSVSSYAFNTNLTVGSRGPDVLALQQLLASKGFFSVPPTGYFGSITQAAVSAWQASMDLPATGFFGPLSRAKLNEPLAMTASSNVSNVATPIVASASTPSSNSDSVATYSGSGGGGGSSGGGGGGSPPPADSSTTPSTPPPNNPPPPPPPPPNMPNPNYPDAPSDFNIIGQQPFDGPLPDWDVIWNDIGLGSIVNGVWQLKYPLGFVGGTAPATIVHELGNAKDVFIGFQWMANADWQGHISNVNKLAFLFFGGNSDMALEAYGYPPSGPYELRTCLQFRNGDTRCWLTPNVNNVPVTTGQPHNIEWLVETSDPIGASNGVVKFWLDGTLIGDYEDVIFPQEALEEFKLSPTWGGVTDAKLKDDYFYFDNLYLSTK